MLLIALHAGAWSQVKVVRMPYRSPGTIYYDDPGSNDFHLPPPKAVLNDLKSDTLFQPAQFILSYNATTPIAAHAAFKKAAEIWSGLLSSGVPIHVQVNFSTNLDDGVLAGTLPGNIYKIYTNGHLEPLTYNVALAEKISGRELNGKDEADISMTFNLSVSWYYGVDGNPGSNQHDLVSVALHEMAHGLGFFGLFTVVGDKSGDYLWRGNYEVYDYFLEDAAGHKLIDENRYPVPSATLFDELTTGPVYSASPIMVSENGGQRAKLYIPPQWNGGSSLYHLDQVYNNTENALMTYSLSRGESMHDPGPITMNLFRDMGWVYTRIEHDSLKDREELNTDVTVACNISSEAGFDPPVLHFSYNNFALVDHVVSETIVPMAELPGTNEFEGGIGLGSEDTRIWYYIEVSDRFERKYTYPPGAPATNFTFYAGKDTVDPVVDHIPVDYLLDGASSVELEASVTDNLGVDTVIVEYSVEGVEQEDFGLAHDSANIYSGTLNLSAFQLNLGDSISYRLVVRDLAMEPNTVMSPAEGYYTFHIEEVPDFQESYESDFEVSAGDFLKNGFQRSEPEGWSDFALHSDHPYKAPAMDNTNYDFYAQLRVPIKLGQSNLSFREIALIEPGDPQTGTTFGWNDATQEANTDFYDYVVVEGSTDNGQTWHPFADGWDCRLHTEWETLFNSNIDANNNISRSIPDESMYRTHYIDLLDNAYFSAGDVVLIRFRLHSDPYFNGWGWAIDNVNISPTAATDYNMVPGAVNLYPNPAGDVVHLELSLFRDAASLSVGVYDMVGKRVLYKRFDHPERQFEQSFDLGSLENGIYFFRINSGPQTITRKIVVAR